MDYQEIIDKIKNLEIQGARNIAIAAIEAFGMKLKETQDETELKKAHDELVATRATEPALRNGLKYCLANYKNDPKIAEKAVQLILIVKTFYYPRLIRRTAYMEN